MFFCLIDCNNFFVSCERAFNPRLEKKPVIVLSNNDGCIISRSNEAKTLNIPMGAPFFQWELFCKKKGVYVYSSNYELYHDMSQRVMALLKAYHSNIEIYSIDEAFMCFDTILTLNECIALQTHIKQCTGIPVSIGFSKTKTLAKIANHIAKRNTENGVFFLLENAIALNNFPIEEVWGIGRQWTFLLKNMGIYDAQQLKEADPGWIRVHSNVWLERTVRELNNTPCFMLETQKPKKQIMVSRSFGKKITQLTSLEEAISYYLHLASQQLRNQNSTTTCIELYLKSQTMQGELREEKQAIALNQPTANTNELIKATKISLHHLYKAEHRYIKAGICLKIITSHDPKQQNMLEIPINHKKKEQLMTTMDAINKKMGKETIMIAACGLEKPWLSKCIKRSWRYTTRWDELPITTT